MGSIERVRNLDGEGQNQFSFHRSPADAVLQRQAIQKFHGDECVAVLVVNLVDGTDVWMIQGRSSFGFALKAAKSWRVCGYNVGQELECYKPAELHIFSLVDNTHPTTT